MEKVAGIILIVKNIDRSAKFYTDLGFTVVKSVPDVAITVGLQNFWVELLSAERVVTDAYKLHSNVSSKGVGSYLQINVTNVDTFYDQITQKDIRALSSPKDYPWGYREFTIQDPDGYILCMYSDIS